MIANNNLTQQLETAVAYANQLRLQRDKLRAVCGRVLETGALKNNPLLELTAQKAMEETLPAVEDFHAQTAEVMTAALRKQLPDMPPVVVAQGPAGDFLNYKPK